MPQGNAEAERRGDRPLAGPGGYAYGAKIARHVENTKEI